MKIPMRKKAYKQCLQKLHKSKMKAKNTIFKNGLNMKKGIILLQITPQVTPHDLMEIIA